MCIRDRHQPYRIVALRAAVAVGTVTACLQHLREHRYLVVRGADRTLNEVPDLIARWVAAYADVVRPRLAERRLQVPAGDKPDPVSYTHLRAHETVLDLVC